MQLQDSSTLKGSRDTLRTQGNSIDSVGEKRAYNSDVSCAGSAFPMVRVVQRLGFLVIHSVVMIVEKLMAYMCRH